MFATTTQALQRFHQVKEQNGRWAAWEWLADRVGSRLINLTVSEFVTLEVGDVKLSGPPPQGFDFRFLTAGEVTAFAVDPANELNTSHAARAAAGHDLCFAAVSAGRLAAYGWYALGCIEAQHCDGVPMSFPGDAVYMYKGFTHPDFRGQRLHGYIMGLALQVLHAERNVQRLVSTVSWTNAASLKSCERLGYRRQGRMIALGWGRKAGRFPQGAQDLGVCFGRRADLSSRQLSL
jgi:hypothetical protein